MPSKRGFQRERREQEQQITMFREQVCLRVTQKHVVQLLNGLKYCKAFFLKGRPVGRCTGELRTDKCQGFVLLLAERQA